MDNFKRNNIALIIVFGVLAVIIPLIVHFIFVPQGQSAPIESRWKAGEFLEYCGSALGAIATILVLIYTISFTIKNQEKEQTFFIRNQRAERKLEIKPHLYSNYKSLASIPELPSYGSDTIYITIGHSVNCNFEVPRINPHASENAEPATRLCLDLIFLRTNYVILYELSNVGAGNALNLEFWYNNHLIMPAFALLVNAKKFFVIILKDEILIDNNHHFINFNLRYSDVASLGRYEQIERFDFYREGVLDEGTQTLHVRRDMADLLSLPREIRRIEND